MTATPIRTPSLGHPSTDPPTLVARARAALGWVGSDFVVGLRGYPELMATLDATGDLDAMVRVGDPSSPPVRLLRALNALSAGLCLTRTAALPSPWRWVRLDGSVGGRSRLTGVALRQQTYSDVVADLTGAGVTFRVLPDDAPPEVVLATGRELGSAVVDVEEVPLGATPVPDHLADAAPLLYGLVSREEPAAVDVVWLAMAAEREGAGTLMTALQRFSDLGLDLDFLHSDPQGPAQHDFYLGFRADADRVTRLQEALTGIAFSSRVLAAFGAP